MPADSLGAVDVEANDAKHIDVLSQTVDETAELNVFAIKVGSRHFPAFYA